MGSQDDGWFDDFENSQLTSEQPSEFEQSLSQAPTPHELEPTTATSGPSLPYKILDKATLEKIQADAIQEVTTILGCSTTTARVLLIYFNWDPEVTLQTLAERGEESVFKRAGVTSCNDIPPTDLSTAVETISCMVCMCDITRDDVSAMACGHAFCNDCWRQHMTMTIKEGQGRSIKCMSPGCGVICEEITVRNLLQDEAEVLEKYDKALLESYVEDNKKVKWCPSVPHCGRAARVNQDVHVDVACPCGQQFCFNCLDKPHSPATCIMLREWMKRIQEGSETVSWLNANTKQCPKCDKPVEKNGGCNLVVCRCGQAFCWLCGQATGRAHTWTNIEGHSCGAYKDEAERKASNAERVLKRYLHYLTRYEAHLQSLKFEQRIRRDLDEKVEELIELQTSMSNLSWVNEALEQLFLARRTLSYSYIFAYYMFGNEMYSSEISENQNSINKALFEDKQGQLEAEVERLAKLVESGTANVLAEQRMAIINLSTSINARIVKMYEVIENDIAVQLAGCSLDIAPYRGQRTQAMTQLAGLTVGGLPSFLSVGRGGESTRGGIVSSPGKGGAGRGGLNTGGDSKKVADIIDLTKDDEDEKNNRLNRATPVQQKRVRRA